MLPGESEIKKDSHCSYCGVRFTEQIEWPRKCFRCYNDSYSNPTPVVVVLISIQKYNEQTGRWRYGLLIQQRNIEPQKGNWALTGGYIDRNETWEAAAVREVKEELNVNIRSEDLKLYNVVSSTKKDCMLIFCTHTNVIGEWNVRHIHPTDEVQAVDVMWEPRELAFPAHTEMANKYLAELKGFEK